MFNLNINTQTGLIESYLVLGYELEGGSNSKLLYLLVNYQVRATDGGGLTGTGTASIELQDENDSPPKFQRKMYTQSIDETPGTVLPDHSILDVAVNDADTTNNFVYGIVQVQCN